MEPSAGCCWGSGRTSRTHLRGVKSGGKGTDGDFEERQLFPHGDVRLGQVKGLDTLTGCVSDSNEPTHPRCEQKDLQQVEWLKLGGSKWVSLLTST